MEDIKQIINNNVVLTGHISDEELKVLYKNAKIYAFPSIMEGFGIPIIDAQQFSIPTICTDMPVFREVAGNNGALFFKNSIDTYFGLMYNSFCRRERDLTYTR